MKFFRKTGLFQIFAFSVFILTSVTGCRQPVTDLFTNELDSVRMKWVPDPREGIFDVNLNKKGRAIIIKGETDNPEAKSEIISFLRNTGITFVDSLKLIPDTALIKLQWGLVNVSVCNLRSESEYSAELVSQSLMGTPVRILKREGGWYLIQTPDKYLGWVDSDAIAAKSINELNVWKLSRRIFYTGKTGEIFENPRQDKVISDIVAGCILTVTGERDGLYEVTLPDGRRGFAPEGKCIILEDLTADKYLNPQNLLSVAESFMGIPYLWGGTSSKGFDCSGFIKTVYYLNGLILSRDASQQFRNGTWVNKSAWPDSLEKGDLLFFGSVRNGVPKATHVAMYMGNSEFIHASGMVRINSLDSARSNFSRYRRNSFLGIRRIIGAGTGEGITKMLEHKWYK